jgi:hypothetical protein
VNRPTDPGRINPLVTGEQEVVRLSSEDLGSNPPFETHVVFSNWYGAQAAQNAGGTGALRLNGGVRVVFIPEEESISTTLAAPGRIIT